jgi:hypothetical protein
MTWKFMARPARERASISDANGLWIRSILDMTTSSDSIGNNSSSAVPLSGFKTLESSRTRATSIRSVLRAPNDRRIVCQLTADSKVIWNVTTIEFECDVLHGVKDGSNGSTDLHQDGDLLVESIGFIVNTKLETR